MTISSLTMLTLKSFYIIEGYALTRETVKLLVEKGIDQRICNDTFPGWIDDIILCN